MQGEVSARVEDEEMDWVLRRPHCLEELAKARRPTLSGLAQGEEEGRVWEGNGFGLHSEDRRISPHPSSKT